MRAGLPAVAAPLLPAAPLRLSTAASRDDVVRAEMAVSDLAREQKKYEDDIESVRARKTRDEDRMSSGAITNSKQLEELQHEVQTLTRRQSDLEDAELHGLYTYGADGKLPRLEVWMRRILEIMQTPLSYNDEAEWTAKLGRVEQALWRQAAV